MGVVPPPFRDHAHRIRTTGRLRVVRAPGQDPGRRTDREIGFTGWLGLLRALYEVTAQPGEDARPGP